MAIPSLTLRNVKGSALTFSEMDVNLQNLANARVAVSAGGTTSNIAINGDTGAPTAITFANSATVQVTQSSGTITLTSNITPNQWNSQFTANVNGQGFYLQNTQFETYREKTANISSALTGTVTVDANVAPIQTAACTGNITINTNNLTNFLAGESVTLILRHTGNTRTFTSNLKFVNQNKTIGGTTNVTDVITIFYDGTEYLAAVAKYQA
jgi:hypothetical protein